MKRYKVVRYTLLFSIVCLFLTNAYSVELSNGLAKQDTSNCHATYFPAEGKLLIPCIDVVDATGNIQAYRVVLEQLATTDTQQFMVKEWFANPQDLTTPEESNCQATYLLESGKLLMPCVDVVDSSGQVESHEVVMRQVDSTLVELPKLEVLAVDGVGVGESHARSTRSLFGGIINLTVSGPGKVTSPKGTCSSNQSCSWSFSDIFVTLTATPETGSQFVGWSGGVCLSIGNPYRCMVSLVNNRVSVGATFSSQQELKVSFFANDIGRVTSSPAGINCTREPCSAKFAVGSTVTLTATPLTGRETGNHFVGWECKNGCTMTNTATSISFKMSDKPMEIKTTFKIERCFGAVGAGCGLGSDDSFNGSTKQYPAYAADTNSDVAVGSIRHDNCCLNNPSGWACGFAEGASLTEASSKCNNTSRACCTEWNKAVSNKLAGRTWLPKPSPFGPYAANLGDSLDSLGRLKAPDGTKLDATDAAYCVAGKFRETGKDYGICGLNCTLQKSSSAPKGCWCESHEGVYKYTNPTNLSIGFENPLGSKKFFLTKTTYCTDPQCSVKNYTETQTWTCK